MKRSPFRIYPKVNQDKPSGFYDRSSVVTLLELMSVLVMQEGVNQNRLEFVKGLCIIVSKVFGA
jgi:hypothetical protein